MPKTQPLMVWLEPGTRSRISAACLPLGKSLSAWVRELILRELAATEPPPEKE